MESMNLKRFGRNDLFRWMESGEYEFRRPVVPILLLSMEVESDKKLETFS